MRMKSYNKHGRLGELCPLKLKNSIVTLTFDLSGPFFVEDKGFTIAIYPANFKKIGPYLRP
jgi:hypothetical protein